jgi:tetratricopeptide (TPR) repeat protein
VLLPLIRRRGVNILLVPFQAALPLLAVLFLPLANGVVSVAAAESTATSIPDGAATTGDTDTYLAQLRTALPQSWLQREFQRQRSFPAFAHSRQLVAKGQYEEAFEEVERYLASDPDDLVIQFGYLILATGLKRYRAAIGAADRILVDMPDFAPARFYRGLARAALGEDKEALPDLAAAVDSKALAPVDSEYARRSLAMAAVASPADSGCARARGPRGSQLRRGQHAAGGQGSAFGTPRPQRRGSGRL